MKRFLLFGGDQFYPRGGGEEFLGSFTDLDGAVAHVRSLISQEKEPFESGDMICKWAKVWDTEDNKNYRIHDNFETEELTRRASRV